MRLNIWHLLLMPFANMRLERAVRRGDMFQAQRALADGADPKLRLMHAEPVQATVVMGACTLVDDGDVLTLAMDLGHDDIGLLLANAGAAVPPHYHDRIVSQRWKTRLTKGEKA